MGLGQSLLPELDHEGRGTRATFERVPDAKLEWRPHGKSMTLGGLATHLAGLPTWMAITVDEDSFDLAPPGASPPRREALPSRAAILATFDRNLAEARAILAGATDETLLASWTLRKGGNDVFTMPRIAVVRSFILNHTVHHRAQLGVYLRLLDVPVPSLYGPSADEQ